MYDGGLRRWEKVKQTKRIVRNNRNEMGCRRITGWEGAEDGCGLWSWQGYVLSRRPVAQGIDSCPSVTGPIISANIAPI